VQLLHRAEALLREQFFGLSKNRILLAFARLQLAVDLFAAPHWPTQFGLLSGLKMTCGTEHSRGVLAATSDGAHNPFIDYYRNRVVPSIPAKAQLTGISITHESQIIPGFTLARAIKVQRPDLHVILGGATVSVLRETLGAENALWPLYDSMVAGAGEESIATLQDLLTAGSADLSGVPGLYWRTPEGSIRINSETGNFDLAQAATPVFTDPRPNPILTIATSTGCDWGKCRFCHFPSIFPGEPEYCVRPVDAFIRDIDTLMDKHKPSYFHVCDTNLSIGQVETLSDAILESGLEPLFYSFVRAEKQFTDISFCRKVN